MPNTYSLTLWVCLALALSAITTTIFNHNLIIDSVAISLTVVTCIGILVSGALLLAERIMETCSS